MACAFVRKLASFGCVYIIASVVVVVVLVIVFGRANATRRLTRGSSLALLAAVFEVLRRAELVARARGAAAASDMH